MWSRLKYIEMVIEVIVIYGSRGEILKEKLGVVINGDSLGYLWINYFFLYLGES